MKPDRTILMTFLIMLVILSVSFGGSIATVFSYTFNEFLFVNGTNNMNATLNMSWHNISNVVMSNAPGDAANVSYVQNLAWNNDTFYLRDNSRTLTSEKVRRDVDNDLLSLYGGNAIAGGTGIISLYGSASANPNDIEVVAGDGGVGNSLITSWRGGVAPVMDMNSLNITGIRRIVAATDAVNKSYVDDLVNVTTYKPQSTHTTGGTPVIDNVARMQEYDSITYDIQEGNGASPLDTYINFTGVSGFTEFIINEFYLGSPGHHIQFQLWDFNTNAYHTYWEIVGQVGFNEITVPVFDATDHIETSTGGTVMMRLHHVENGNVNHYLYIDYAWLLDTPFVGSSTDLSGYAQYLFDGNNFQGTGNFNTTGIGNFSRVQIIETSYSSDVPNLTYLKNFVWNNGTLSSSINESYAYLPGRSGGQILIGGSGTTDDLYLNASSAAATTNTRLVLQGLGGPVDIGTPAVASASGLSIKQTAGSAGIKIESNLDDSQLRIDKRLSSTMFRLSATYTSSGSYQGLGFYTSDLLRFYITPQGNVSQGSTTTPTAEFQTSGTNRMSALGAGTCTFDSGGNITSVSDEKYKTDIKPFTFGLSAILNTNPINYKFNSASGLDTQNVYTGFSAQQLQTSIPSAVYSKPDVTHEQIKTKDEIKDAKTGEITQEAEYTIIEKPVLDKEGKQTSTLSITDRAIIATEVNAIKELNAKIEAQNITINKQQAQINNLSARLSKLEVGVKI